MITQYHRPATLDEAIELVGASDAYVIVEGMASDHVAPGDSASAIDLQSLGLDRMIVSQDTLTIGAMATLASVSDSPLAPPMIAELAGREYSSAIRNAATVGGVSPPTTRRASSLQAS
jgi:CO/xanthine dehydrogenase FAD-binding subunit